MSSLPATTENYRANGCAYRRHRESSARENGVVLLIDAANVIGSRPTGWWKDRPGAARAFVEHLRAAAGTGPLADSLVVVLEGQARRGVEPGVADGVKMVHAPGSGDDTLVAVLVDAADAVTLVSADRALRQRALALGARVASPGWLIDLLSLPGENQEVSRPKEAT
jgi:hypothetical protein